MKWWFWFFFCCTLLEVLWQDLGNKHHWLDALLFKEHRKKHKTSQQEQQWFSDMIAKMMLRVRVSKWCLVPYDSEHGLGWEGSVLGFVLHWLLLQLLVSLHDSYTSYYVVLQRIAGSGCVYTELNLNYYRFYCKAQHYVIQCSNFPHWRIFYSTTSTKQNL